MKKRYYAAACLMICSLLSFGQWKLANGPYGGISRSILFKGTDVYAASSGGGVFRSSDNGLTWKPMNNGITNFTVGALALNGNIIFAGTDGGGIFLSSDNGVTWTKPVNGFSSQYVRALAANDTFIFAGTGSGVYVSSNNGSTWANFSNGLTTSDVRALIIHDTLVFAGTYGGGIFRSGIKSNSWAAVNSGVTSSYIYSFTFHDSSIFAASGNKGVFVSSTNGSSWTASDKSNNGLENDWVNALTSSAGFVFAATYSGVSASQDNGQTWNTVNTGLLNKDIRSLAYNGTLLFGGSNDGGVFASVNNGMQWALCGLQNTSVTSFMAVGGTVYAGAYGNYGVHETTDLGNSWTPLYSGITNRAVKSLAHSDTLLFAGTDGGGIFLSYDSGKNWAPCDSGFPGNYFYCFALLAAGNILYAGTENGVYRTANKGISWNDISGSLSTKDVRSLCFSGTKLYAGTKGGGVFIYDETNSSWSSASSGLTNSNIYSLDVKGSSVFAGTGGGLFVADTAALSWTAVTNGIGITYVYALADSANYMLAGTQGGIYFSQNSGVTWVLSNSGIDGIASKDTRALIIHGTTVFAGMYEGACWTRDIADFFTGTGNDVARRREEISVYPNPFFTDLNFECKSCAMPGVTEVVIYDLTGKEIRRIPVTGGTFVNAERGVLADAAYIYRVVCNGKVLGEGRLVAR